MSKKKPKMETIVVNGVEIERRSIDGIDIDHYYIPFISYFKDEPSKVTTLFQLYRKYSYCRCARDRLHRREGIMHLSKTSAIKHAMALLWGDNPPSHLTFENAIAKSKEQSSHKMRRD